MIDDLTIKNLTADSRQVKPGDLFIAVPGLTVDGRQYINEAIEKGASAICYELDAKLNSSKNSQINVAKPNIPIIPIPNLKGLVGPMAARFFDNPSEQISVIGITGTNGKTSVSHFIAQILSQSSIPCGVIGTLGTGFPGNLDPTYNTSQDAISFQKSLANAIKNGAKAMAIEATSHALTQNRVTGINFHTTIFTNLTRDHLDYHGDMKAYANAKQTLFSDFNPLANIINLEDEFGGQLWTNKNLNKNQQWIGYTTHPEIHHSQILSGSNAENLKRSFITTHELVLNESGISALIQTPWGNGKLQCALLGRFNLSNILAALAAACLQGIPLEVVLKQIQSLKTVPGRMMRFGGNANKPLVVVDYAHTPDALAKVLEALRAHCQGKLCCVFGCGGDRDRGKRPLMTAVVETLSDVFYLTQDNPRTEDPKQIFSDMIKGLKNPNHFNIEPDRKKAIFTAIQAADYQDIVLIAGKGHEDTQIIGNDKLPFSDPLLVEEALNFWRAA